MASVTASRTGLERIPLEVVENTINCITWAFLRKRENEARNPKLDMVWCAATLGLVVKTITRNKKTVTMLGYLD